MRKYFISKCNRFRFTLDENISFKAIDFTLNEKFINQNLSINSQESILEIKYNVSDEINELIDFLKLPFRVSRYSKYIIGLSVTGKLKIWKSIKNSSEVFFMENKNIFFQIIINNRKYC